MFLRKWRAGDSQKRLRVGFSLVLKNDLNTTNKGSDKACGPGCSAKSWQLAQCDPPTVRLLKGSPAPPALLSLNSIFPCTWERSRHYQPNPSLSAAILLNPVKVLFFHSWVRHTHSGRWPCKGPACGIFPSLQLLLSSQQSGTKYQAACS